MNDDIFNRIRESLPPVIEANREGTIGIVGGCSANTEALVIAAVTALRIGAKKVRVFCPEKIVLEIRACTDEIIVHPLSSDFMDALAEIKRWIKELDVIAIGARMSDEENSLVYNLLSECKTLSKPTIVDLDWLLSSLPDSLSKLASRTIILLQTSTLDMMFGEARNNILIRLARSYYGFTIFEKGKKGRIYTVEEREPHTFPTVEPDRRCAGYEDFQLGALATFYFWAFRTSTEYLPTVIACFAASNFTKRCNDYAFNKNQYKLTTFDMIDEINQAYKDCYVEPNPFVHYPDC